MRRKWSPLSKLLGAMAAVLALAAFLLVRGYAARVEALAPALGPPVHVLVAARDVPRGAVMTPDMLREAAYPGRFAPPRAVSRLDGATGRTLLADLAEGEILTATRLAPRGAGPLAALVPEGFRAFSVQTSLPPGSVRPGDHVDLLATFATGRPHTETISSGLEVLLALEPGATFGGAPALGPEAEAVADAGAAPGETLVLLVRPEQAESLAYARAFADLTVSVVGPEEAAVP